MKNSQISFVPWENGDTRKCEAYSASTSDGRVLTRRLKTYPLKWFAAENEIIRRGLQCHEEILFRVKLVIFTLNIREALRFDKLTKIPKTERLLSQQDCKIILRQQLLT